MSGQFLADILKIENSVKSDSSEFCCICLQDFGTLSSETGVIECEVRLPCSHCLGSSCIASWLRSNNTCPVCRRVFFPAEPRPVLEHGIVTDEALRRLENQRWLEHWPETCHQLNLSDRASVIAFFMSRNLLNMLWLEGHTVKCVGSAALYIASYIMGEPKSPEDISIAVDIQPDHIRSIYRSIHPVRDQLVVGKFLEEATARANLHGVFALLLKGASLKDMLALLPTPTYGNHRIDTNTHLISRREHLDELSERFCTELGYDQSLVAGLIDSFCQDVAHKICKTKILAGRSPQTIIAVSIYMASHLLCVGTSIKRISEVVHVSEDRIQEAYTSVYPSRDELVKSKYYHRIFAMRLHVALTWPAFT